MRARIVVVGLGPAGPDLVTAGTLERLAQAGRLVLRTTRHPAASVVAGVESFDHVYDTEPTLDAVYRRIVAELVDRADALGVEDPGRELVYVVPGSPVVAERTVELLLAEPGTDVEVVPALSFLDLAWVRLGVDPIARSVRVVDGQRFEVEAAGERGPLLVAQCDSATVLSDVKLALDGGLDPSLADEATVVVLQRLGLPDEAVFEVPWADLDRTVEPDHLTSLYLPELEAPVAVELQRFVELVARLRAECPWDREQTHDSLRRHLLEESYEVLDAIDHLDEDAGTGYEHLEEELGDLLFQVVFHATLAREEGRFTMADVASTVHDKLRARHPHVFGGVEVDGADDVVANWEQIKKAEKGRASVFDGIPDTLPALLYALKVQKKASTLALDLDDEVADALEDPVHDPMDVGGELYDLVANARVAGIDPEDALRRATRRRLDLMRALEQDG